MTWPPARRRLAPVGLAVTEADIVNRDKARSMKTRVLRKQIQATLLLHPDKWKEFETVAPPCIVDGLRELLELWQKLEQS